MKGTQKTDGVSQCEKGKLKKAEDWFLSFIIGETKLFISYFPKYDFSEFSQGPSNEGKEEHNKAIVI